MSEAATKSKKLGYDVVIVGGGMIGTSLALALAPLKCKIAVVEAVARREPQQPSFDDRSTALSRSTQRMFQAMGLWDAVVEASTPILDIHVSDRGHFGFSHIDAHEQGVEALGYVVINRVLGGVLQSNLDDVANVDVFCPAKVAAIEPGSDEVLATLKSSQQAVRLCSPLIVAADGANSSAREMLGITAQKSAYGQRAIVGNMRTEMHHKNRAYERFTAQGPLAILPITDDRVGFVWTVSEDSAERIIGLDSDDFLLALQSQFGNRLGEFSAVGRRASYPLILSKAMRLVAQRSVLIGNAAHGLHPAAAQGFNLGMRDVAALCDCIADALKNDADLGSAALLDRYSNWRRGDQQKLLHFTDNLVRAFGSNRPATRILRNMGMIGFDLLPGVRTTFAKHTMGLAGKLPRLSRGVSLR